MFLAFGVVCALLETQRSGKGQVVDAAMVDGSATLMALMYGMFSQGSWKDERGVNVLDTGAPWYNTYATKDGKWLAVGAIEELEETARLFLLLRREKLRLLTGEQIAELKRRFAS